MERGIQLYAAPVRNTNRKVAVSVMEVHQYIKYKRVSAPLAELLNSRGGLTGGARDIEEATRVLRQQPNAMAYRAYKSENLPYALPAGLFSERNDEGLIKASGLICLDFDHLGDRQLTLKEELLQDPYFETALLYTSPGGDGLKWWTLIDLNRGPHRMWARAIRNYVCERYHAVPDSSCDNESRACFLAYDPDCRTGVKDI